MDLDVGEAGLCYSELQLVNCEEYIEESPQNEESELWNMKEVWISAVIWCLQPLRIMSRWQPVISRDEAVRPILQQAKPLLYHIFAALHSPIHSLISFPLIHSQLIKAASFIGTDVNHNQPQWTEFFA